MSLLKRPFADLDWSEDGPVSRDSGDVYFSIDNGLDETRAVFLNGTGFPECFKHDLSVVGELGFGTGLNFLALWHSFLAHAPKTARLHFISVEGFPLKYSDAVRALSAFPEISRQAKALLDQWPSPHKGPHRLHFDEGRVSLTIYHDDVGSALKQMDFQADAWFLDGFSPAKNPDMWAENLYQDIARLSKPDTLLASFTVAGHVRRGLAAAGFEVTKHPGFGRKRERLQAVYKGAVYPYKPTPFSPISPVDGPIAIIGSGIAAASLIKAFQRKNRPVEVFAEGGWASGASGAPLGLLTPRLNLDDQAITRFFLGAYDYARRLYQTCEAYEQTGSLSLFDETERSRAQKLATFLDDGFEYFDTQKASLHAGEPVPFALWQARSGRFKPETLIRQLVGDHGFHNVKIQKIDHTTHGVRLLDESGLCVFEGSAVIYAGGAAGVGLIWEPSQARYVSGRVGIYPSDRQPTQPIDGFGYLSAYGEHLILGSSHIHNETPDDPEQADICLRDNLAKALPKLSTKLGDMLESWGGTRLSTPDHDPIVGSLPGPEFANVWAKAAKGHPAPIDHNGNASSQTVFTLTALGGRGFSHAPLLAEALVSRLCGEPSPIERDAFKAVHPARFQWRALKR